MYCSLDSGSVLSCSSIVCWPIIVDVILEAPSAIV